MSQQGRGMLPIYLGSAAGVGNTYVMPGDGHCRAERGTDVVVGFVETYGRLNTERMAEGLEGCHEPGSPIGARSLRRWTLTRSWPASRRWRW